MALFFKTIARMNITVALLLFLTSIISCKGSDSGGGGATPTKPKDTGTGSATGTSTGAGTSTGTASNGEVVATCTTTYASNGATTCIEYYQGAFDKLIMTQAAVEKTCNDVNKDSAVTKQSAKWVRGKTPCSRASVSGSCKFLNKETGALGFLMIHAKWPSDSLEIISKGCTDTLRGAWTKGS